MVPLFAYCACAGKLPEFITDNVDQETLELLQDVKPLFVKLNVTSVAFAVVVFFLIFYVIYR